MEIEGDRKRVERQERKRDSRKCDRQEERERKGGGRQRERETEMEREADRKGVRKREGERWSGRDNVMNMEI